MSAKFGQKEKIKADIRLKNADGKRGQHPSIPYGKTCLHTNMCLI